MGGPTAPPALGGMGLNHSAVCCLCLMLIILPHDRVRAPVIPTLEEGGKRMGKETGRIGVKGCGAWVGSNALLLLPSKCLIPINGIVYRPNLSPGRHSNNLKAYSPLGHSWSLLSHSSHL